VLAGKQRQHDQERVSLARQDGRRFYVTWLVLGPGILAMLGENDGPSMLSYAADGTQYGTGFFLPFIAVLFVLAYVCQEMSMRVGAATGHGFGYLLTRRYGKIWGWFGAIDLILTNLVTLVSEFIAIGIGFTYFHLPAGAAAASGVVLVVFTLVGRRYRRWERIVLGLALFNGLFLVTAILTKPDGASLAHAFVTWSPLPTGDIVTLLLLVTSTIGATVTPWMVFFQQSATADKGMTARDVNQGRLDTAIGAALAAVFGCAALIVGASIASRAHTQVDLSTFNFPAAIAAHSGQVAGMLFALGLIEAGAVALLTISASTAYAIGETLGRSGFVFYAINIVAVTGAASIILIPGVPLIAIALNANVLATVLLPVTLIFLVMLANDRHLMGSLTNNRSTNIAAGIVIVLIGACATAYTVTAFLQTLHALPGS
jgi:Mn2+/Fe2+ NRAMP family transporter